VTISAVVLADPFYRVACCSAIGWTRGYIRLVDDDATHNSALYTVRTSQVVFSVLRHCTAISWTSIYILLAVRYAIQ